jgi:hypothetical protein
MGDSCLYIAVILVTVFAVWRWGDWKNWRKYHSTMLFIIVGVLLYLFLYKNALLWDLQKHILNHTLTELLFAFTVLPSTVLLLLTNYPDSFKGQSYRIGKFIAIYSIVELIYWKMGFIDYDHGWNFWLSIGWYCMMFPMLVLHLKKPLYAYIASVVGLVIFLYLFPVKM